ncbi:MAG: macrocin O-methyltransferase [Candidatus Hydrogenedentota bacterium]|nr:MAG: macrocin O-methyltransferase [Candidatus Hydrogenedentota bacterium]
MDDNAFLKKCREKSLLSEGKLRNLARLARLVNRNEVPGDFVECGVFRGGSAAILSRELGSRHLWLYDSFEGMPPTEEIDGPGAKECVGLCVGSEEDVHEILRCAGVTQDQYDLCVGLFEETFKKYLPNKVALLHCDADWYRSVSAVLDTFYPLMPPGSVVILDDFGCWEGCREAFYDFCFRNNEKPLLERLEYDQAYWIKGRKHNRTPEGI